MHIPLRIKAHACLCDRRANPQVRGASACAAEALHAVIKIFARDTYKAQ
jgi:hypothetical protein